MLRNMPKMKIVPKYANTKILTHNTPAKKSQAQTLQIKKEISSYTKRENSVAQNFTMHTYKMQTPGNTLGLILNH